MKKLNAQKKILSEISFVIPLYNKEKYIARCISSIINQGLLPLEIVIVDDGSTDKSISEVNLFKSDLIKVIKKKNGGVSSARNAGISASLGKYIAFIDADDELIDEATATIADMIIDFPKGKFFGFGYKIDGIMNSFNSRRGETDYVDEFLKLGRPPISSSSVVICKDTINTQKFPTNSGMGEDIYTWIKLSNLGYKLYYDPKPVAIYHSDDPQSATQKKDKIEEPLFLQKNAFTKPELKRTILKNLIKQERIKFIKNIIVNSINHKVLYFVIKNPKFEYLSFLPAIILPKKLNLYLSKKIKLIIIKIRHWNNSR